MTVLLSWLTVFFVRSFFYNYFNYKFFSNEARNKVFLVLVLLGGLLSLLKVFDIRGPYFFYNSFETAGLSSQIDQCFILMPLLVLFSGILKNKNDKSSSLLPLGTLVAMASYNLNIIFSVFSICKFFSIEKENKSFQNLRKEMIVLLLVIFPFIFSSEKIFSEALNLSGGFFLLLVLLNAFDIWSMGYDKNDGIYCRLRDMILVFPLRMTMLAYCASSIRVTEYLDIGKIIFLFLLLASFLYGVISHFNLRSLIVITQTLFLSISLSSLGRFYMEFYFILGLLVVCGANTLDKKKGIEWVLTGLSLIILLSLLDGPISLIRVLVLAFDGDNYSKIIGISLLVFLVTLIFQWGKFLKKVKSIKVTPSKEYAILVVCIVFNVISNMKEDLLQISWTNKIIISFLFIIMFLVSYIVNLPRISFERANKFFLNMYHFLEKNADQHLSFRRPEDLLQLIFRSLLRLVSFIQGIIINSFFILVDMFEYRGVRKYEHVAMLLLITFLFLWIKVLGSI